MSDPLKKLWEDAEEAWAELRDYLKALEPEEPIQFHVGQRVVSKKVPNKQVSGRPGKIEVNYNGRWEVMLDGEKYLVSFTTDQLRPELYGDLHGHPGCHGCQRCWSNDPAMEAAICAECGKTVVASLKVEVGDKFHDNEWQVVVEDVYPRALVLKFSDGTHGAILLTTFQEGLSNGHWKRGPKP